MEQDCKSLPEACAMTSTDHAAPHTREGAAIVYATFPDAGAAQKVAEAVVTQGLAACANIIPGLTSVYIWEGRLEREQEVAMIMKTRAALAERLVAETRRLHPYANPALIVLPVAGGSAEFLAWIGAQTAAALDHAAVTPP
jgi:periplasmic divalent cation tolerance protein